MDIFDKDLIKNAENGDPKAQFELGQQYHNLGEYDQAIYWLTRASDLGYMAAKKLMRKSTDLNYQKERKKATITHTIYYIIILISVSIIPILLMVFQKNQIVDSLVAILSLLSGMLLVFYYYRNPSKTMMHSLSRDVEYLKSVERYSNAASTGDKEAEANLKKIRKKKDIDDIVDGLKTDKIEREHSRVQWWYWICIILFFCLIGGFAYYMFWNVDSIHHSDTLPSWQEILVRIFISMSFLSMIFILMNQAARSRKNLVLLSKEIQEYQYIGALLKGKVDMSTNEEETNKSIDSTFDKMIEQHLTIQKQRLEKEDHTEVKDITPDVLNFFKENTSTIMDNYKTIIQTLKDSKGQQ